MFLKMLKRKSCQLVKCLLKSILWDQYYFYAHCFLSDFQRCSQKSDSFIETLTFIFVKLPKRNSSQCKQVNNKAVFEIDFVEMRTILQNAFQRSSQKFDAKPWLSSWWISWREIAVNANKCTKEQFRNRFSTYSYHISSAFQRCRRKFDTFIGPSQAFLYLWTKMKTAMRREEESISGTLIW